MKTFMAVAGGIIAAYALMAVFNNFVENDCTPYYAFRVAADMLPHIQIESHLNGLLYSVSRELPDKPAFTTTWLRIPGTDLVCRL